MSRDDHDFSAAFDLSTWDGPDAFQAGAATLADEVAAAMAEESADHDTLRDELLTRMDEIRPDVRAKDAGVYRVTPGQIRRAQRSLLCGGAAATGTGRQASPPSRRSSATAGRPRPDRECA